MKTKSNPVRPNPDRNATLAAGLGRRIFIFLVILLVSIRWVDSTRAQGGALTNDGANAGTIGAGATNTWSFTAAPGDQIVLRLGTTNFSASLVLEGAGGARLAASEGGSDVNVALMVTNGGAYSALVSSATQGGSGAYLLHFAQIPEPFSLPSGEEGGPMVNGGDNVGTLRLADLQMWTFTAKAGDNVVLRMATTNFDAGANLYAPGGGLLASACCVLSGDTLIDSFTATNSGTYTVLVDATSPGGVGSYILRMAEFSHPFSVPAAPLTNGDNGGSLVLGGLDRWTFTAKAGDNVVLRMVTTNFDAAANLYAPDGGLLVSVCCVLSGDTIIDSFTATNSGTYTVLVDAANPGGVGSYILRMAEFSQPFSVPATPLTNGDNGGSLVLGGLDRWTFTAKAGDNVVLRMATTNFDAGASLYAPGGGLLASVCCAQSGDTLIDSFTATNSGTYTVLVNAADPGGVGSYILRMAEFSKPFSVPAAPLTNGDNGGSLVLGGLDRWTFTAKAGDNVVLRMFTTNFDAAANLYGPDGGLLVSVCCALTGDTVIDSLTATNSGTYTVLVNAADPGGVGSYILRMAEFSQPFSVPAAPLTNGDNGGSLVLGGLDRWTFTAKAGDNVVLRMFTTNFDAAANLYGPDGGLLVSVCCALTGDTVIDSFTVTNSGTYTVLVDAASQGGVGSYILRMAEFSQPFKVPAALMANGGDNLGSLVVGGLDRWTFNAKAGDNVVLRMFTTNFDAAASLYGPDGALLASVCCAPTGDTSIDSFTAANSGTYTVLVDAASEGGVGSYILRLVDPAQPFNAASFPLSNSVANLGVLVAGGLDRWEFTACVGDWLYPQFTTTNFIASLGLYGPDGALMAPGYGTNITFAVQATNCGTFTILITSASEGGVGAYSLFSNGLSDGTKLCPPAITAPVLTLVGIGGATNSQFILYTTTNLPAPAGLWTSIYTNRFDPSGVFNYTNSFAPSAVRAFFRLRLP